MRGLAGDCTTPGIKGCAPGFEAEDEGCAPLMAEACTAGTRARLGAAECVSVGWTDCPAGFETTSDGYGCQPILPEAACSGATYAKLGETECQPVGDCNTTFPPDEATFFVDASYQPSDLDETHFKTIQAAVTAAVAGTTVSVAQGTYEETLVLTRAISIIGQCAQRVVITGSGAAAAGVWIQGGRGVRLQGLTFSGHDIGVEIDQRSQVELQDLVLDGNRWIGLLVHQSSEVSLRTAAVRNTQSRANGSSGRGINIQSRARFSAEEVSVSNNREIGLYVSGAGTETNVAQVVVSDTMLSARNEHGVGILVSAGGKLGSEGLVTRRSQRIGLRVMDEDSTATLRSFDSSEAQSGSGVDVLEGASLQIQGGRIWANHGAGLVIRDGAALLLEDTLVSETTLPSTGSDTFAVLVVDGRATLKNAVVLSNEKFGVLVEGAEASAQVIESLITQTMGDLAPAVSVIKGASAVIEGSTLKDNGGAGLLMDTSDGRASMVETIVQDTRPVIGTKTGGGIILNGGDFTMDRSALLNNYSLGLVVGRNDGSTALAAVTESTIHYGLSRVQVSGEEYEGYGIWVSRGSTLSADATDISHNQLAGLGVQEGAFATVTHSTFRDSRFSPRSSFGFGIANNGDLDISDSAIIACRTIGLHASGPEARVLAQRLLIKDTKEKAVNTFGHGLVVSFSAALELYDSEIVGSAAGGFVVQAGAAMIGGTVFADNQIGLYLTEETTLDQVTELPDTLRPQTVHIREDTRFVGNQTKTSGGLVPLPEPVQAPR